MPEIEAKFLVQDPQYIGQLLAVLRELGYGVEPHANQTIVDRYFDTPDWTIFRAGWGYRLRDSNGKQTLALKGLGLRDSAIQVREEIEQRLLVSHNRLSALPSGPVQNRLAGLLGTRKVRELFVVRNQRSVYMLSSPDEPPSTVIELAIDQVQISGDPHAKLAPGVLNFGEIELELKRGSQEPLVQLAGLLPKKVDILPARLNKFQRGLQTTGLSAPTETTTPQHPLSPTDPLIQLAYYHLAQQARILRLQQPRAWEGLEPEGVHQMRVAMRHIRAALRVFREVLPARTVVGLNAEFRWAARVLGEVRDLDVYRENLTHYMEAIPADDAAHLALYERHLAEEWQHSRRRLIKTFSSRRYIRLMERFKRFVQRGPSAVALRQFGAIRICDAAAPAVDRNLRQLLKRGRAIEPDSPAELLHALRIRGKRLRYLLEFLREVYKAFGDPLKKPIDAIKQLQDVLGNHQDACVASERLRDYAQAVPLRKTDRRLLLALGQLISSQDQHAAAEHHRFGKVWRRFEKTVSRKRLAIVLQAGDKP